MSKQEKKPGESLDSLLRRFKRKVKQDGTIQSLKDREYFEKPSETKKKELRNAKRKTYLQQKLEDM